MLGLAWRGYTNAEGITGGVCQTTRVGGVSYNSAISTGNSFGSYVSDNLPMMTEIML